VFKINYRLATVNYSACLAQSSTKYHKTDDLLEIIKRHSDANQFFD